MSNHERLKGYRNPPIIFDHEYNIDPEIFREVVNGFLNPQKELDMVIVKDYGSHFLRDDTMIRAGCELFKDQVEGYSLFQRDPYHRVKVFGGTKDWAIEEADKLVKELTTS